jgi:hypothetical protein
MVILSLLFLNTNKRLWHKKAGVKKIKIILSILAANVNYVDCDSDSSSDESNEVYAAEFCWLSKAQSCACDSLKPVHKNRQEEIKFTFDVAKCDKIFDELHKASCIKMSHTIPPLDEFKWKAYCRWHNSFSHATNDCNVFHRQVQSAINEGRLSLKEM